MCTNDDFLKFYDSSYGSQFYYSDFGALPAGIEHANVVKVRNNYVRTKKYDHAKVIDLRKLDPCTGTQIYGEYYN